MNLRKIFTNSIWFGLVPKLSTLLNVLILPFITPYLTPEDYGLWGVILSYSSIGLSLYSLGLHMHLTNGFYEFGRDFPKLWSRIFYWMTISSVVFSLLFAVVISRVLEDKNVVYPYIISAVSVAPILLNPIAIISTQYYTLHSNPRPLVLRNLTASLSGIVVLFSFVRYLELGFVGYVFSYSVSSVVAFLLFFKVIVIKAQIRPVLDRNIRRVKELLTTALPVIPHALGFVLISSSSRLILSWNEVPLAQIGLFSHGLIFGDYIGVISTSIVTSMVPLIQASYRNGDMSSFRRLYKVSQIATIMIILLSALWMKEIYLFLIRNSELFPAYRHARLLVFMKASLPFYFFASSIAFIEKRTKQLLWLVFIPSILNCILVQVSVGLLEEYAATVSTIASYLFILIVPFISSYHGDKTETWLRSKNHLLYLLVFLLSSMLLLQLLGELIYPYRLLLSVVVLFSGLFLLKKINDSDGEYSL